MRFLKSNGKEDLNGKDLTKNNNPTNPELYPEQIPPVTRQ